MRVTFDSNVWEFIVRPEAHRKNPHYDDFSTVHGAIKSGRIKPFISETFATVEAIKRRVRFEYLEDRPIPIKIEHEKSDERRINSTISIIADPDAHPGLMPILKDRLSEAFALGFKIIPSTRLGTLRPPELQREEHRIELTDEHRKNIWVLMQKIDDACSAIERRGVGMSQLVEIAKRIQARLNMQDVAWFDGLNRARDEAEKGKIALAFSEWADGDSVALHIGYELDVFCTHDKAKPGRPSVFDQQNRDWLSKIYHVRFMSIGELAAAVKG
ncbi:hypothetical protein [Methylobacterium sp. Leaf118]|uniref:hypothetical protein n=1 Tax=Methylobacterium sp. Leaf118 TaxID=2876562 RepID=UPI001E45C4E6|nr:hypothetical protein [Methylobacterium sp. Leaf118]